MPPAGFHLTWSKAAVIVAALGLLQGAGWLVGRPRVEIAQKAAVLEQKVDSLNDKVDALSARFNVIEACLLDRRCGR